MRLLLVEDHVPLADELLAGLNRQGYAVDWLADGRDAVYQGSSEPYDLIVLDLGLPGLPGLEVLSQWRAGGLFQVGMLFPKIMIAQVPTMVTPQNNDGIVEGSQRIQCVQQNAHLSVHIRYCCIIPVDQLKLFFCF